MREHRGKLLYSVLLREPCLSSSFRLLRRVWARRRSERRLWFCPRERQCSAKPADRSAIDQGSRPLKPRREQNAQQGFHLTQVTTRYGLGT